MLLIKFEIPAPGFRRDKLRAKVIFVLPDFHGSWVKAPS
jgi:hypothetical protein